MKRIDPASYAGAHRLYNAGSHYFPLVGAVLEGSQDGAVYADDAASPRVAFVQHAFGFAQAFGAMDGAASAWLERHALIDRAFEGAKLRLYAPAVPHFLLQPECIPLRSERQRFHLPAPAGPIPALPQDVVCEFASVGNVARIDAAFGVVTRFWRTASEFVARSNCILVTAGGAPAALCYGAAVASSRAEIDVFTLPEHRQRGLGRIAVAAFNARCAAGAIEPLWDCFTNNAGSMMLARSIGFVPTSSPYAFFTIPK